MLKEIDGTYIILLLTETIPLCIYTLLRHHKIINSNLNKIGKEEAEWKK